MFSLLSYQHIFHAGNLADVHKHSLLAWILHYLSLKAKPISYIETHAGRGLYNLTDPEALKTGEAARGILSRQEMLPDNHPYVAMLRKTRADYDQNRYPGSPLIALGLLRQDDRIHLAELHPQEFATLRRIVPNSRANCYQKDGFELALSLSPPQPRRGLLFIDPSYELKTDYDRIPDFISRITRRWNVGVVVLWYPLLAQPRHSTMMHRLQKSYPQSFRHEVQFAPAQPGHGMVGSGLFITNPPFGIEAAADRVSTLFEG